MLYYVVKAFISLYKYDKQNERLTGVRGEMKCGALTVCASPISGIEFDINPARMYKHRQLDP